MDEFTDDVRGFVDSSALEGRPQVVFGACYLFGTFEHKRPIWPTGEESQEMVLGRGRGDVWLDIWHWYWGLFL